MAKPPLFNTYCPVTRVERYLGGGFVRVSGQFTNNNTNLNQLAMFQTDEPLRYYADQPRLIMLPPDQVADNIIVVFNELPGENGAFVRLRFADNSYARAVRAWAMAAFDAQAKIILDGSQQAAPRRLVHRGVTWRSEGLVIGDAQLLRPGTW